MESLKEVNLFPQGEIPIPPSKSVAHRAIICSGLAGGTSIIENVSSSLDMAATIRCLQVLGVQCQRDGNTLTVNGGLTPGTDLLDCGESGSTLRFLIPVASLLAGKNTFTGQGRLMERPLTPYLNALHEQGVNFSLSDRRLTIEGPLQAGVFNLPGDLSSQYVSGLLLALPLLNEDSEITVTTPLQSASYVELTIEVMKAFGVFVRHEDHRRFFIKGGQNYSPRKFTVETDYSQAAFFLVASALGCECQCQGLSSSSKQGDRMIVDIMRQSGIKIDETASGSLIAKPGKILPQTVDVSDIPDLVPPLAVFFCFAEGTSQIINAGRLRHKESDRLHSVATELNALGADITEGVDFLTIAGVKSLRGGRVKSWGDHRIAMMLAVAAIKCRQPVWLEQAGCVSKSYPNFWEDYEKISLEGN